MDNPLHIHPWLNWVVAVYLPILIICSLILNFMGLEVLKSTFLQDLISVPILRCLMVLHLLLPVTGPFYVWLVQCFHMFITTDQIYPCFLMLTTHNFLMVASSWTLVLLTVERAITMSKSKAVWKMWQTACGKVTLLAICIAMIMAIGPLMMIRGSIIGNNGVVKAPICLPWWGHEGHPASAWFHFIAVISTVGPCLAVAMAIFALIVFLARFCTLVHWGSRSLEHYQAMNVGLKSVMHVKFVHSVLWLGFFFVVTSGGLGLHILLESKFDTAETQANASSKSQVISCRQQQVDPGSTPNPRMMTFLGERSQQENVSLPISDDRRDTPNSIDCMTRADVECFLWILYYSFSAMIVPILLASEVLFRREWRGKIQEFAASIMCLLIKGRRTQTTTLRPHNHPLSCSDSSFGHGDVCNKLDPDKNSNLQCFVNTSTRSKTIKLRNATGDDVSQGNDVIDDDDITRTREPSSTVDP